MPKPKKNQTVTPNRFLAVLPTVDFEVLRPHFEAVEFEHGEKLYEAGGISDYVYFPSSALISIVGITNDGDIVEVGMVGNEGMAGLSVFLGLPAPYRTEIQVPGEGLRMRSELFRQACARSPQLQRLLLKYVHCRLVQVSQSAICNRFHTVEERLARWLLSAHDRVQNVVMPLTQEYLSHLIGSGRPAVTIVAGLLQNAGLIKYGRGYITIIDRTGLEAASCECYRVIKQAREQFLQGDPALS